MGPMKQVAHVSSSKHAEAMFVLVCEERSDEQGGLREKRAREMLEIGEDRSDELNVSMLGSFQPHLD